MAAARPSVKAVRGMFAGAVLAGGESRRMGREKARLRVDGETLWRRQVRVLREAGAEPVAIVRQRGQRLLARNLPCLRDEFDHAGPLAGVHAALAATEMRWVAVLAVDMPAIEAAWFERLRQFCRPGCGAVVRSARGLEPLAAIYPREAAAIAARRLAQGRRSMQEFVAALGRSRRMKIVGMPRAGGAQLQNWNTPADRRADRRQSARKTGQ